MKVLVLVCLMGVAYGRPGVTELSGSYLPGVSGGSSILSSGIGGSSFDSSSFGGGSSFGGSSFGGFGGYSGIGGGYSSGVNEQRHVYFYAAPDDEAPARLRVNIAPSSARNTKIIFVKAPSSGGVIPEVIAPPSHAEDKTLVYVLVKKQDHGGQITIPSSLGVRQAKPQVYFIKYRNQHEAEQAVVNGLHEQAVGDGLADLGNEGTFVRTLSYGGVGGIGGGGILGGGGISSGGASLLSGSVGGGSFGSSGGSIGVRYGTPGASGPYKR